MRSARIADTNTQHTAMNGAESLLRSLVAAGVEVCFTNPGTSEMHFVAALDRVPGMRAVLGLQENVVTGAADGYGTAGSCREAHDIGRAKHRSFIETYGLDAHQFPLLMLRPSNWAEPFITVT